MEEAFVPIEGAEKRHSTQMGDPIAKARHQPLGKARQKWCFAVAKTHFS